MTALTVLKRQASAGGGGPSGGSAAATSAQGSGLCASRIRKRYEGVVALREVDFSVAPREIVALAGENGSGKSTLARILAGVTRPDDGVLAMDGHAMEFAAPSDALAAGVSMVSQEVTAVPAMSVAENVLMPILGSPFSIARARATVERARSLMRRVGLRVDPRIAFEKLTPGEAVLAEVARSLSTEPQFLILDEVTTRLGGPEVERLFQLLESLRAEGLGVTFITHRLSEITRLADRAVVLRDGSLVGELSRREVSEHRVSAMMVGRELEQFSRARSAAGAHPRLELREVLPHGFREPVSLQVRAGEVVGLAGLVGSGRSETLETVAGARPALAGSVLVDGAGVRLSSVHGPRRAGIAFVPEDRHRQALLLQASVCMNATLGSWRWRTITNARGEISAAWRCVRGMRVKAPHLEVPVSTLSGGNQQKVVIGRALSEGPRVLLLDEPTRGIDVGTRAEIFQLIERFARDGIAVLMASSDLMEILALCDRVVVMHDRSVAGEIPAAEATEEKIALLAGGAGR